MGCVQVWSEHFDLIGAGFPVPGEYEHLPFSLTYGDDVGKAVVSVLKKGFVPVIVFVLDLALICACFVPVLCLFNGWYMIKELGKTKFVPHRLYCFVNTYHKVEIFMTFKIQGDE